MTDWRAWAPPLDPPTTGGLDRGQAEAIADLWWDGDPHRAAALMWEAWCAILPPALPVAQVSTGSQSLTYSPASPAGNLGLALARAAWHRSCLGTLHSVPLRALCT